MNEIQINRIDQIKTLHEEIVGAVRLTLTKAIELGGILEEQKAETPHGAWSSWIEENLPFDIRTAQRYMKAYANRDQLKNDSVSLLTDAYRLLEEPKELPHSKRSALKAPEEMTDVVLRELHQAWKHVSGAFEDRQAIVDAMVKRDTAKLTEPSKIERLMLTIDWTDYFMLKSVESLLLYEIRENINEKNRVNREEVIRECKEHLNNRVEYRETHGLPALGHKFNG